MYVLCSSNTIETQLISDGVGIREGLLTYKLKQLNMSHRCYTCCIQLGKKVTFLHEKSNENVVESIID